MTVIRPNGISGVTSITSSGDAINFYRSDGTLGPELGINVNVTSGVSTFAALNVTGVLTYEDVASVDSVGIITARSTIDAKGDVSIADKIIHTGDTNTAIRFPAADTITAETSGSERLRIDSSGRLLVGASSPAAAGTLAQYATFVLRGDTGSALSAGIINLARGAGAASMSSGFSAGVISFSDNAGLEFGDIGFNADGAPSGSSTPGRFVIKTTASGSTTPTERMRIDSSGDLYIGGTSGLLGKVSVLTAGTTDTSLHLATSGGSSDNGDATNTIRFTGGTNSRWANAKYEAFAHIFHSNGAERARLTATGNFGVGTNSPATPLVVSNSGAEGWELGYTSGTVELVGYNRSGSARSPMKIIGQTFLVQTGNPSLSNGLYQDANGKVLIGTQTTSSYADRLLTVGNTSHTSPTIEIRSATNGQPGLAFSDSTAGDVNSYRGTIEYNHASNYMMFRTDAVERLRISSSGDMGLGINSPSSRLHVKGAADCYVTLQAGATSGNDGVLFKNSGGTQKGALVYDTDDNYLLFNVNSAERMRINANGYSLFKGNASSYYNSTGTFHQFQQNTNSYVGIFNNAHSTPYGIFIKYDTTPNNTGSSFIECEDSSAGRFRVVSNGGIYNYSGNNSPLSDEREKKNIASSSDKWNEVKSWELKNFHYNDDADTDPLRFGVIAQQIETVSPELVVNDWEKQSAKDAVLDDEGNVITPAREQILRKGIKEQQMMWTAIKALQEAQARIETLETEVAALKAG